MKIKTKVIVNAGKTAAKRGLGLGGRAQQFIDSEVLRLCEPYVPMRSKELIRSGIRATIIGQGQVIYDTPYARRWYMSLRTSAKRQNAVIIGLTA